MDEKELEELQDPGTWRNDDDEVRPPVRSPRAIVSVAFARDDFERVVEHAQRHGMKTSEFIRRAALDHVRPTHVRATVVSVSGGVRTGYPSVKLRGAKAEVRIPSASALYTA